jgi:aspartate/methionine/tyrosine aminotransferase
VWNGTADPSLPNTVEILAYPNNPDGAASPPRVQNKSHVICDMVYNWGWNHFPVQDLQCENTIFSLSKATGHCASRVGWAFIKDPLIFEAAKMYNIFTAGGVSVEAQARTQHVLQHLVDTKGSFFEMGRVRCAFLGRNLHSRRPLVPTPARLRLLHACDQ